MAERKVYVSGGHVYCQVAHADRDIEECFGCRRLKQLNDRASPPYVLCDTASLPGDAITDPEFMQWWYQHHRRAR
jgi:hypothetical protein